MFDFRYHALSLVAVFIALLVGLLLGVAIGDRGLVSSAERDLRASLRADVEAANERADELRSELSARREYEEQAYPPLVADRLSGQSVALLFLGGSSDEVVGDVRDALTDTGARLVTVGTLELPPDVAELAERAEGTRYRFLDRDDTELLSQLGFRMGVQFAEGGNLIEQLRPTLFSTLNGELDGADAVIVVRRPGELDERERELSEPFEEGVVRGLVESEARVVAAETEDADPSQIGWYSDRDLTSVDAIDRIEGKTALVLALDGAEGTFGIKDSAGALLPEPVGGSSPRVASP